MRIAILTARGGSKGLPGKNVRVLGRLPLIAWTVLAARASGVFDRVILSTDDDAIAEAGSAVGAEVPFRRPEDLASDTAASLDVVRHAVDALGLTDEAGVALLQPTSPFRSARHIREAAALWENGPVVSMRGGKPVSWSFEITDEGCVRPAVPDRAADRRQAGPRIVLPNGGLYMTSARRVRAGEAFIGEATRAYLMGEIDSLDIDTPEDFELAEAVVAAGLRRPDTA